MRLTSVLSHAQEGLVLASEIIARIQEFVDQAEGREVKLYVSSNSIIARAELTGDELTLSIIDEEISRNTTLLSTMERKAADDQVMRMRINSEVDRLLKKREELEARVKEARQ